MVWVERLPNLYDEVIKYTQAVSLISHVKITVAGKVSEGVISMHVRHRLGQPL